MASPFSLASQPNPSFSLSQPSFQPQQPSQPSFLLTTDKTPVTYHTKWADLHPDSQNFLLQIEARILEYRDECRRLDQCDRLYDSVALNEGFETDAVRISQDLGGISTAVDRYKVSLQELMKTAKEMMRNAEVSVRSFAMLKTRFPRAAGSSAGATAIVPASSGVITALGTGTVTAGSTQAIPSSLSTEFYSGVPVKPSPFLMHTISRFEHQLQEFRQWVEELERLIFADYDENGKEATHTSLLQSLPSVMKNIHDFFIYVAAKVETLHQQMWSIRTTYLADQRKRGDDSNPFLEADRREIAKREAAAKRVHPTLQAATATQPSTQAVGMLSASTSSSGPSATPSILSGSSTFPAFNTAGSLSSASATSFSTPSLSLFGSSSSATSTLFGSSGASPSLSFGAGTPASIFGSGSAAATPSTPGFGASAASPSGGLFGATPPPSTALFGSTTPGFGTPSTGNIFGGPAAGGSAFGMGTGQVTATAKAKGRTTRRK